MKMISVEEKNVINLCTDMLMESMTASKALVGMLEWTMMGMIFLHLEAKKDKETSIDSLVDTYKDKLGKLWDLMVEAKKLEAKNDG